MVCRITEAIISSMYLDAKTPACLNMKQAGGINCSANMPRVKQTNQVVWGLRLVFATKSAYWSS